MKTKEKFMTVSAAVVLTAVLVASIVILVRLVRFDRDARSARSEAVQEAADAHVTECAEHMMAAPRLSPETVAARHPECADVYVWLVPELNKLEAL